jgi:hypothetical protein
LRILDFATRWRRVVNFTPQPLCRQGKSCRYPLDRKLGALQSRFGRSGEKKVPVSAKNSVSTVQTNHFGAIPVHRKV